MRGIRSLLGSNVGYDFWRKKAGRSPGLRAVSVGAREDDADVRKEAAVRANTRSRGRDGDGLWVGDTPGPQIGGGTV